MANPTRVIRRPNRPVPAAKPAPVSVKEEDFDEDELDETEEYEDEEEDTPPAPKAKVKSAPAPVLPAKPAPRQVVTRKMEIPTVPSPELKEAVNGEVELLSDPIPGLVAALEEGKTLHIQRKGKMYLVSVSDVAMTVSGGSGKKGKVDGNAYWNTVLSPDYLSFQNDWQKLTLAEKIKKAKAAGAEWEEHENVQTHAMRISQAYREVKGIEKYKPEYESRASRDAVRKALTS